MQDEIFEKSFISEIENESFWSELAPNFHIGDTDFLNRQRVFSINGQSKENLQKTILTEGYIQLPALQWELPIAEMEELVKNLDTKGIPLPFTFVYDEYWLLFTKLGEIIKALLGEGYLRLPDFWTWHVDPQKDQSGWKPHRDKGHRSLFEDGSPKAITVWIPLSVATPLNGCIYLVPADRDPTYGTVQDKQWKFQLADIRALPAQAGSVFMWNQAVLHWGSHSSTRATESRVSIAYEFQAGTVDPFNEPLTRPEEFLDFGSRIKLVAKQILQYKHMYPLQDDIAELANSLMNN